MKTKIDSAKPSRTFGDPPVQVYEVVAGGVVYDCMNKKCMDLTGQEVEFEVKQPSDPKYHPTMRLKGEGGQAGSNRFGSRGYQIAFGQTVEGEKLRSKTMTLSYAKDMVTQFMAHKTDVTFAESLANIKSAYDIMLPLLRLDQVRDTREQVPQDSKGQPVNGQKNLATLLVEMKPITSLDAFSNWWKTIPTSFNALSTEDQQKLVAEKDKKKAELTGTRSGEQTSRQPSF